MILSIGVFGWSPAKLIAAVSALEKEGHHVTGYEAGKLDGYDYIEHDRLIFAEYGPDILEMWKEKAAKAGKPCAGKVEMPPTPRGFGEPVKVEVAPAVEVEAQAFVPSRSARVRKSESE